MNQNYNNNFGNKSTNQYNNVGMGSGGLNYDHNNMYNNNNKMNMNNVVKPPILFNPHNITRIY